MKYLLVSQNPLLSRGDVEKVFMDLWTPLERHLLMEGAAVSLEHNQAHYGEPARFLEAFARPLWGLAPFAAGGGIFHQWNVIREVIECGVDPGHPKYWGLGSNKDHRFTDYPAIASLMAFAPTCTWKIFEPKTKDNIVSWLSHINTVELYNNNWLFFRVLTNLSLAKIGAPYDLRQINSDLTRLDEFYCGEGWYGDGNESQIDYYLPMTMHYYSLIWAGLNASDSVWTPRFKERAQAFAPQFAAWFANDGSAIPFGRSLTYRFAQGAFWGALAFANVEALPWGVIKDLYLKHLRWWLRQPIFTETGILSVGYGYPNLSMAEDYNGPGSPYWAFKIFLPLALPSSHPFWQAEPSAQKRTKISLQRRPGFIINHDEANDHLWALSSNRSIFRGLRHATQKYSKFVYSATFGFSTPIGGTRPENGAGDSTLLLSDDNDNWRTRSASLDQQINGHTLYTRWEPWSDVIVETWLLPVDIGHLRIHYLNSNRPLFTFEGGFCLDYRGESLDKAIERFGYAAASLGDSFSAICDLRKERRGELIQTEPNTNIIFPLTVLPGISGKHDCGQHWLLTACLGIPQARNQPTCINYCQKFSAVNLDGAWHITFDQKSIFVSPKR
ncbi:MAG TPA: DUF2264 domain-containing protein [Opitutaceae bacterium]|nr:DUF2264 domain-containing protein [Opitutaceae bacterium]